MNTPSTTIAGTAERTPPLPQHLLDQAILDGDRAWRDAGKDKPFSQYLAQAIAAALRPVAVVNLDNVSPEDMAELIAAAKAPGKMHIVEMRKCSACTVVPEATDAQATPIPCALTIAGVTYPAGTPFCDVVDKALTELEQLRRAVASHGHHQEGPMFWVRLRSDGGFDGPIHSDVIEDVRKRSGAWLPLYLGSWSTVPDHIMAILRAVHRRPSDAAVWLDAISDVLRAEHARQAGPQHERDGVDTDFGMPQPDMARFLSDTDQSRGQEGGAA